MSIHLKAYRYRILPTPDQEEVFMQWAGARRFVYNWALARRIAYYKETSKSLSVNKLCAELTVLKRQPETAWLRDMNAQSLQQAIHDLDKAFKNFFGKRAKFPRFRSKKRDRPTYKARWAGKHLIVVGRFFPSTRLCPICGAVNSDLTLADRAWICGCGAAHDRDLNAACNIRDQGLRLLAVGATERLNAPREPVRPATRRRSSMTGEAPPLGAG